MCWLFPPLLGVGGILFSAKRPRSVATAGWGAVLAVALVCIYLVLGLQTMTDTTHTMVTSSAVAGETHEILFVETSLLLGGRYTVYEKVSPGLVYYLGSYITDDGETPVTDGRYEIDWRDDGFAFTGGLAKEKFFPYAP